MANKQITKANIAKRNTEEEKVNEQHHDIGEKEDRSLVDIYYSALKTNQEEVCKIFQIRFNVEYVLMH
jgi:hypothetical protein